MVQCEECGNFKLEVYPNVYICSFCGAHCARHDFGKFNKDEWVEPRYWEGGDGLFPLLRIEGESVCGNCLSEITPEYVDGRMDYEYGSACGTHDFGSGCFCPECGVALAVNSY